MQACVLALSFKERVLRASNRKFWALAVWSGSGRGCPGELRASTCSALLKLTTLCPQAAGRREERAELGAEHSA